MNVNGRNGVDVIFQRKLGLVEQVAYLGEHVGGSMQLQVAVLVAGVVGGMGKLVGVAYLEGHVVIDLVDELLKLSGVDAVGAHGRTSFRKVLILHPLQGTVYDRRGAQSMRM